MDETGIKKQCHQVNNLNRKMLSKGEKKKLESKTSHISFTEVNKSKHCHLIIINANYFVCVQNKETCFKAIQKRLLISHQSALFIFE